jgi:hypothetical protein
LDEKALSIPEALASGLQALVVKAHKHWSRKALLFHEQVAKRIVSVRFTTTNRKVATIDDIPS